MLLRISRTSASSSTLNESSFMPRAICTRIIAATVFWTAAAFLALRFFCLRLVGGVSEGTASTAIVGAVVVAVVVAVVTAVSVAIVAAVFVAVVAGVATRATFVAVLAVAVVAVVVVVAPLVVVRVRTYTKSSTTFPFLSSGAVRGSVGCNPAYAFDLLACRCQCSERVLAQVVP